MSIAQRRFRPADTRRRASAVGLVRDLEGPVRSGAQPQLPPTSSEEAEWLRFVIASAYDAFISVDSEGLITDWSPRAEATFGWSKEEVLGKLLVETIMPYADRGAHLQLFKASLDSVDMRRRDHVVLHRDGHTFLVELVIWTVQVGDSLIANAFIRDVTVRSESEDALAKERRLLDAAELAKVGPWEWDIVENKISWSDQMFRNSGFEPGEFEPSLQAFLDTVHPDDLDLVKNAILGSQPIPGQPIEYEHRVRWPDGSVRWLYARNDFVFDDAGKPTRLYGATHDITSRKLGEEAKAFLATVVDATDDAIISLDITGRVSSWNPGAQRMFGYSSEEAIGSSLSRLVPADRQHDLIKFHENMLAGMRVQDLHTQRLHRDGSRVDVSVSWAPITNDSGKVIGGAAIIRDISVSQKSENRLKQAFDREQETVVQLRELDGVRSSYVSTVSHELRTPLSTIFGYLDLLENEPMTADQRTMLDAVYGSSQRLLHLIEDLLTIGKIESGPVEVRMELVDVASLIERARTSVVSSVSAAGQELIVRVADDIGPVRADACSLERVLINLLTNAVKFTPRGGVIRIAAEKDNGGIAIAVSDTGMGICEEDLRRVFEPFYRSPKAVHDSIQGTGLGLAIVEKIVEQHGGTISCESVEGAGSTFTVRIPTESP